jgi:hypothetical protein
MSMSAVRICLLLCAAILVTRGGQFALPGMWPDATLAALFLGGLWLPRSAWILPLLGAAIGADAVAIYGLGVPGDCLSPAYLALVPIYMLVWSAGWWTSRRARGSVWTVSALALATFSVALVLSNAAWYLLSPDAAEVTLTAFVSGIARWYSGYALAGAAYVLATLAFLRCVRLGAPRAA